MMGKRSRGGQISVVATVVAAMLWGVCCGVRLASSMSSSALSKWLVLDWPAIAISGAVVIVLVVTRSLSDRRIRFDSYLLDTFLEHIPDNIFFKDRNSRFLRISRSMANYIGLFNPLDAVQKSDADIFSPDHATRALRDEQEILRTGHSLVGIEERETWPNGRESWVLTTKVPLKDSKGRVLGTMGISHDITDRKNAQERIQYLAHHDPLTGLANRPLLQELLMQAIFLASRNGNLIAVLLVDLDRFKLVNDRFGHQAGDRLLEFVSNRINSCLRESDIVGRLGGDEFVVVLPDVSAARDAECVAQKLLRTVSRTFVVEGSECQIGASIGISLFPSHGNDLDSLLRAADLAMYQAKADGGGESCVFTDELEKSSRFECQIEQDLRFALARDQFLIYYQPIVSTDSTAITGVEALLRWHHPELGTLPASQFIPQLEKMGLMAEIGAWMLRSACMQLAAWQREDIPPIRLAVNLSAQQFYYGDIVDTIKTVLWETGMDPTGLELELTESLAFNCSEATVKSLRDLKQLGITLSLDDFGTGWSSLTYLQRFPIDRVKIDQSFTRNLNSQPSVEAVVRCILALCRDLEISCIAEGVESQQEFDYFREQSCAEVQGFLCARPMPAEEFSQFVRARRF